MTVTPALSQVIDSPTGSISPFVHEAVAATTAMATKGLRWSCNCTIRTSCQDGFT